MTSLLKNDLKRFFLNKLNIILLVVAFALPLFLCIIYKMPSFFMEDFPTDEVFGCEMIVSSSFSYINDFGIILPIFGCVLLSSDRSSGIQRNKMICGKTRKQIYLSQFISCILYFVAGIIIYLFFNFLFGFSILGGFVEEIEFIDLLIFILLGILKFAALASFVAFIGLVTQKNPIGLTIGFMFIVEIVFLISNMIEALSSDDFLKILEAISGSFPMSTSENIRNLIIYIVIIIGTLFGGMALFENKEIK